MTLAIGMDHTPHLGAQPRALLALVFVVYVAVGYSERATVSSANWLDPDGWLSLSRTLCETGDFGVRPGEHSLRRSPLYPSILASACLVPGASPESFVPILNGICHIGLLLLVLLHPLARHVPPAVAVLVVGLDPFLLVYSGRTYVEPMLVLSVAAVLVSLERFLRASTPSNGALMSMSWALSLLVKPILMYLPVLLVPYALYSGRPTKPVRCLAIMALVPVLVLSPWLIRNYSLSGEVMLQEGSAEHILKGETFARLTLQGQFSGQELQAKKDLVALDRKLNIEGLPGYARESAYGEYIVQDALENPWKHLRKILTQSITFWFLGGSVIQTLGYAILSIPVLLLASVAVVRRVGFTNPQIFGFAIVAAYFVAVHAVTLAFARYSMPLRPWLVLLALIGVLPVAMGLAQRWTYR